MSCDANFYNSCLTLSGTRFELPAQVRLFAVVLLLAACRPPGYGKEPPPDAAEGDSSMITVDAGVDANVPVCDHAFRVDGYGNATSFWMTGSFNNWAGDPVNGAIAFTLGTDGAWSGSYKFQAGTHQYKFVVNGSDWILDPTNPNTADDGMGHTNSVYTCVP